MDILRLHQASILPFIGMVWPLEALATRRASSARHSPLAHKWGWFVFDSSSPIFVAAQCGSSEKSLDLQYVAWTAKNTSRKDGMTTLVVKLVAHHILYHASTRID